MPILHLYFWLASEMPPAPGPWPFSELAIAWTLAMLLFATVNVRSFVTTLRHAAPARQAVAQIRGIEAAHPTGTVEVGVGHDFNDFRTNYSALTALDGQPVTLGGLAVRELQIAGIEIPDSTVQYMKRCGTRVWLIPKGDSPFSATDPYFEPGHPAFDERFRNAFLDTIENRLWAHLRHLDLRKLIGQPAITQSQACSYPKKTPPVAAW